MKENNSSLLIPIGLVGTIISAAVGYGALQARVSNSELRIQRVEQLTEKMHQLELKIDKTNTLLEQHMTLTKNSGR